MKHLKKAVLGALLLVVSTMIGCAYGGAAGVSGDHVVVLRNDAFLFGILRAAYVCKVSPSGLSGCRSGEAP